MTKIKTFANDTNLSSNDKLLGTDSNNSDATRNFTLGDIRSWIGESGGLFYANVSDDYTITTESLVFVDAEATITLPTAASRVSDNFSQPFTIVNISSSNDVTLSEAVSGVSTLSPLESVEIASNGTDFYII